MDCYERRYLLGVTGILLDQPEDRVALFAEGVVFANPTVRDFALYDEGMQTGMNTGIQTGALMEQRRDKVERRKREKRRKARR